MPLLQSNLIIDRCPHCSVANPNLIKQHAVETKDHANQNKRWWYIYKCTRCGGIVTASGVDDSQPVLEIYPESRKVIDDIPDMILDHADKL